MRGLVDAIAGAFFAGLATVLVFQLLVPLPSDPEPTDHTGTVRAVVLLFNLVAGGFVGRRGFTADHLGELGPAIIGSHSVAIFLSVVAGLNLVETAGIVGLASVGTIASAIGTIMLKALFPPKEDELAHRACEHAARTNPGKRWKW